MQYPHLPCLTLKPVHTKTQCCSYIFYHLNCTHKSSFPLNVAEIKQLNHFKLFACKNVCVAGSFLIAIKRIQQGFKFECVLFLPRPRLTNHNKNFLTDFANASYGRQCRF